MLYSTFNQFLKLLQANNVDINNIISSLRAGGTSSNAWRDLQVIGQLIYLCREVNFMA